MRNRGGDSRAPDPIDVRPDAAVTLFGSPTFTVAGREHPLPRKGFALLAILALTPGHVASRVRLRGILWSGGGQGDPGANLRQLLTRMAKVERAAGRRLLFCDGDSVRLSVPGLYVDLLTFSPAAVRQASGNPAALSALVHAYAGDLLADFHPDDDGLDEWLTRERQALRTAFIGAAVALLQPGTGSPNDDLDIAGRLISVDPTQEIAYRARIRAFGAKGDISRCRAAWLDCERMLKLEFGVAPSAETQALAARFLETAATRPALEPAPEPTRLPPQAGEASRPRVAILPPVDPFDDRRLRELAGFLLEDLTIGLSRYRSFRVIAAHTSIAVASGALRGLSGRDWCDYVLASSIGSAGSGYEIKFRLTDNRSSEVIWASSVPFDGVDLPGLFAALSEKAVVSLADAVERQEVARPLPPDSKSAYRLFLEGRRYATSTALQEVRRARRLFREAAQRDPQFAAAKAGLARTQSMEWLVRGAPDLSHLVEAAALADEAIAADDRDARGFREKGYALLYMKRHDESLAMFSEAANRNPNDADLLADYADALAHSGDPASALTVLDRALTLNPAPPTIYRWVRGSIFYQTGRYRDGIAALQPARRDPATARLLAACHAQVGELDTARACVRLARQSLPDFSTDRLWTVVPNRDPVDTRHLVDGLRLAGMA